MKAKKNNKQQAYDWLEQRLLNGDLKPGDSFDRRSVAKKLGMSTAPVHEAMLLLQHENLLETVPRRGTRVRPVGREDVRGQLILREALEYQALRLAKLSSREQQNLLPLAIKADLADSIFESASAEVEFHVALVAHAQCSALLEEYKRTMRLGFFYRISLFMTKSSSGPIHKNVEFLKQLVGATPVKIQALLTKHIWQGREMLIEPTPTPSFKNYTRK